eukprot:s1608_g5.t1
MTWSERKRANWGNIMADFSFVAFETQMKHGTVMALFENPEDLGAIKSGENRGYRPGSMWQFEMFIKLLAMQNVISAAFYQEDFGTEYLKPTRLLLGGFDSIPSHFAVGPPEFDDQGFYVGPLATRSAKRQLVGSSGNNFATTGTEQWPSDMCRWIATCILQKFVSNVSNLQSATTSVPDLAGVGQQEKPSVRGDYITAEPDGSKLLGGRGDPRKCQPPGKDRLFHDGAGLLSMGRWDMEDRIWSMGDFWERLRKGTIEIIEGHLGDPRLLDRACFEMAVRGEEGCGIVRDDVLKDKVRTFWIQLLKEFGSRQEGLDFVAKGQPFYLRLMKELLSFVDDADREFLLQGERGFPVGVLNPLPRTPHAYEEQTAWRLEDDPHMQEEIWRSNYQSVSAHAQFVRDHFDEECAEGLMEKLTMEQAEERFADKIAISSLAVLVEENHQGKKRVIHDATHGTKVNNRIRTALFSSSGSRALFVMNLAYFERKRIAGAGIRLVHELLGPSMPVELLLFADDLEALGASAGGRRGITLAFLFLSILGFPFKWSKQRGGLRVEWIGLFTDYTVYKLGLSPKRAQWMRNWVMDLAATGTTTARNFDQGLGRLGFAAMALTWERPFLGPLYSWCAAVRNKRGVLRLPAMIRVILRFLGERFATGGDLQSPPSLDKPVDGGLLFFTDAKATDEAAWIGGFKQDSDGRIVEWFSEEVSASWAPWLNIRKDPKRIIASLELLASLVAVKLWMPPSDRRSEAVCWLRGKTDNQSNTYALSKWMSTKFPLTVFIMELSESLRLGRCNLVLDWIPRNLNQLADDLTNQKFDNFPLSERIRWDPFQQEWLVLNEFMSHANSFHSEMQKRKLEPQAPPEKRRKKGSTLELW